MLGMRRRRRAKASRRGGGPGQGRPAHEGHDPAARPRRHRGDRPRRPRPRRRRRPDRGRGRRGGERGRSRSRVATRTAGPIRVVRAGIPLLDAAGADLLDRVREGDTLRIVDGEIWRDDELLATAKVLTEPEIEDGDGRGARRDRQRARALRRQHARVHPPRGAAHVRAARRCHRCTRSSRDVTRSWWSAATTTAATSPRCAPYIREYRPVLIGVDGGADALLEVGLKPDVIIGDFDSVSEPGSALRRRARAPRPSRRPRARSREPRRRGASTTSSSSPRARARTWRCCSRTSPGRSSSSRSGPTPPWSSSSTRAGAAWRRPSSPGLRLGPALVDAKGVSRLYEGRVRRLDMLLLVGAAVLAMVVVGIVAEPIHVFMRGLWVTLKDVFSELMINFRFHLASLIAIFLALALGVVVGAGVIDRGVVDTLNDRLDSVESKSRSASRARTTCCASENGELTDAIEAMQCPTVADHAVGEDVGIVAVRGVDDDRGEEDDRRRGRVRRRHRHGHALARGQVGTRERRRRRRRWRKRSARRRSARPVARRRPGSSSSSGCRRRRPRATAPPTCSPRSRTRDSSRSSRSATTTRPIAQFPARDASMLLVVGDDADVPDKDVVMPAATAFVAAGRPARRRRDLRRGRRRSRRGAAALAPIRDSAARRSRCRPSTISIGPRGPTTAALTLAGLRQVPPHVGHYGLARRPQLLPDALAVRRLACRRCRGPRRRARPSCAPAAARATAATSATRRDAGRRASSSSRCPNVEWSDISGRRPARTSTACSPHRRSAGSSPTASTGRARSAATT